MSSVSSPEKQAREDAPQSTDFEELAGLSPDMLAQGPQLRSA